MTSTMPPKAAKDVPDGAGKVFERVVQSMKGDKEDNCIRTFGESLVTLLTRGHFREVLRSESESMQVPEVMVEMIGYLVEEGMDEEGLFRISAEKHKIRDVKEAFNDSTSDLVDLSHFDGGVIAAVTGALKAFFGELPEPLIPIYLNNSFLECQPASSERNNNADKDVHRDNKKLANIVKILPKENLDVLKYLCSFLVVLVKHKEKTKMSADSLGKVFGPTLFRLPSDECLEVITLKQFRCNALVRRFILFYEDVFKSPPVKLINSKRTVKGPMKPFVRYPRITFSATKRRGGYWEEEEEEEEEAKDVEAVEPTTVTDGLKVSPSSSGASVKRGSTRHKEHPGKKSRVRATTV